MLGLFGRPDGMVRRPDGWNSGQMSIRTADREPEIFRLASNAESSEILLNSGIPCKTVSLHTSDFVQTE
jgi:hypothetical protein